MDECQPNDEPCKAIKMMPEIKQTIQVYLENDWIPEQIYGWLIKEAIVDFHPETIYQYIFSDKNSGESL